MTLRRFYLSDGRTKAFAWLYLYRDRLSRLAVLSRLDHFYLIQTHRSIVHARFYNQAELGVLVKAFQVLKGHFATLPCTSLRCCWKGTYKGCRT